MKDPDEKITTFHGEIPMVAMAQRSTSGFIGMTPHRLRCAVVQKYIYLLLSIDIVYIYISIVTGLVEGKTYRKPWFSP